MSNVRGWVGALWMVLLGAGCTVNLDFDALSDGDGQDAGGGGGADAGSEVNDPRDTFGFRDAGRVTIGPVDTEITIDDGATAAPDAAPPSDAGARPPWSCASRDASFCDDFEMPPLEARWLGYSDWKRMMTIQPDPTGSATVLLDVPEGPTPSGLSAYGFVGRALANIEGKPVDIQVDLDMLVEQGGQSGSSAMTFGLTLEGGSNTINQYGLFMTDIDSESHIAITMGETKMLTKTSPTAVGLTSVATFPLRRWLHVSFLLHLPYPQGVRIPMGQSAAANALRVSVDGMPHVEGSLKFPIENSKPYVVLGLMERDTDDLGPWRVRYDNVEVQVRPL